MPQQRADHECTEDTNWTMRMHIFINTFAGCMLQGFCFFILQTKRFTNKKQLQVNVNIILALNFPTAVLGIHY